MASAPSPSPSPAAALYAQPSDVTLVNNILRPWVVSGTNQAGGGLRVHVADFYSADPETLTGRFAATVSIDGDTSWYFLTQVRSQTRGTRKIRRVGDGWWQGETGAKDIIDAAGTRPIGSRKSFSFMRKTAAGPEVRLGWLMMEFYLHQYDADDGPGRRIDSVVLAKLYRSKKRDRNQATDHETRGESLPVEAAAHALVAAKNPVGAVKRIKNFAAADSLMKNPTPEGGNGAGPGKKATDSLVKNLNPEGGNGAGPGEKATDSLVKNLNPEGGNGAGPSKNPNPEEDNCTGPNAKAAKLELHCPRCDYHIGALQVTAPAPALVGGDS